jgi:hypothetical protein
MLTYRVGAAGGEMAAGRMADHLMEQTLPAGLAGLSQAYQCVIPGGDRTRTPPVPRRDMAPDIARALGIDPNTALVREQVVHLLQGRRTDGKHVAGKSAQRPTENKPRIGYIDLCWSADKSVSLAWAFAPTDAERAVIVQAHRDAVDAAMRYVERELAFARRGAGGSGGSDAGRIGWVGFEHFTSRRAMALRSDGAGGVAVVLSKDSEAREGDVELPGLKVAGDPNLHTHVAVPNLVMTDGGRIGSLNLQLLNGRIREFGGVYQAWLAANLRRAGIDVGLDDRTGAARIEAIPDAVRTAFSKRTRDAEDTAREYAAGRGVDWDALTPEQRIGFLKAGAKGSRQARADDLGDRDAWNRQADALGWKHGGAIGKSPRLPARGQRLDRAYEAALPFLEEEFSRRAVLSGWDARAAAARGLVAAGIEDDGDIGAVTRLMRERGIRQAGRTTELVWGRVRNVKGQQRFSLTTGLHIGQERELVRLVRSAAADRSLALTPDEMDDAAKRSGLDFTGPHGRNQRRLMEAIGAGGKVAVGIGTAGSGKSAALLPLADAWRRKGIKVHGVALAWRQSEALTAAGIERNDTMALSAFLWRAGRGKLDLDGAGVVVVDELGLIGTRQALELMRLQSRHGFKLVAIGDERQCQSVEAGPIIRLMRHALGAGAVPELLTTIRQETEREREISLMFRDGRAAEALALKREDGTVEAVPGGRREAIAKVAALWRERRIANQDDPAFTITVSAPTNADAREISAALREVRRAAGEIGADRQVVPATDQHGAVYDLALAEGDRVRLFDRVNASFGNRGGVIGNNGSVLQVRALDADGLLLRSATGIEGKVRWETLRDRNTGRVRLAYGDAGTIDSQQGITSTEHIDALPGGSATVQRFKAYVAESRHRRNAFMITSEGAERQEIADRRPLGDTRAVSDRDIWDNMARNLSRQPEKQAALDFLSKAEGIRRGSAGSMRSGVERIERRKSAGLEPTTVGQALRRRRDDEEAIGAVRRLAGVMNRRVAVLGEVQAGVDEVGRAVAPLPEPAGDATRHGLRGAAGEAASGLSEEPERSAAPMEAAKEKVNRTPTQKARRRFELMPKAHVEALKESVRITEVIGRSVKLERAGRDFKACCPFHDERTPSFHVSDRKGTYTCYGCGEHGDVLDWLRGRHGMSFRQAIRYLEDRSGIALPEVPALSRRAAPKAPEWRPVFPVPEDAPPLILPTGRTARVFNPKRTGEPGEWSSYRPRHVAAYRDKDGNLTGYVIRVEIRDQDAAKDRKFTPQVAWVVPADAPDGADPVRIGRWALWSMGETRPLYHAEKLARDTQAPVIVMAGEKKADALQGVLGDAAVVVSWAGGDHGRHYVDFTPLADRAVTVWPDADPSGIGAALGEQDRRGDIRAGACDMIRKAGAASVSVVISPDGLPKGWDCGDLVKAGADLGAVHDFLDRHTEAYDPARHRPVGREMERAESMAGVGEADASLSL